MPAGRQHPAAGSRVGPGLPANVPLVLGSVPASLQDGKRDGREETAFGHPGTFPYPPPCWSLGMVRYRLDPQRIHPPGKGAGWWVAGSGSGRDQRPPRLSAERPHWLWAAGTAKRDGASPTPRWLSLPALARPRPCTAKQEARGPASLRFLATPRFSPCFGIPPDKAWVTKSQPSREGDDGSSSASPGTP